ncbi:MAG: Nif11-like leader peptide family natural product precursor [Gammaproteobacteria bacterium]|nr:Nif11-like leader peptide family natural product precursor [Gammaproteobacteria bacterium]
MSIKDAQAFKREVYKNPQLIKEYGAILETEGGAENIAEKIAQWGGTHGYDFTAEEALAVRSGILAAAENNELADDELEIVSGGKGGLKVYGTDPNTNDPAPDPDPTPSNNFFGGGGLRVLGAPPANNPSPSNPPAPGGGGGGSDPPGVIRLGYGAW